MLILNRNIGSSLKNDKTQFTQNLTLFLTLEKSVNNFDELSINQKIFLRFYLYYLFQVKNRKIRKKEYLIIKDFLEKYPDYQDVVDLYKDNSSAFIDVIKNLKNYFLYKNRQRIVEIKLLAFREALNDKKTRINFIKNSGISSPAVSRFRGGVDYAISNKTLRSDADFMEKVVPIFHRIKDDTISKS